MSNEQKLKPCPFCGGDVQLETVKSRAGTLYGVVCRNTGNRGCTCAMEQVPSRSAEAAIARWDMRKPEEELHAQLAEAHLLLREAACHATRMEPMSASCLNRIDAALDASAEPRSAPVAQTMNDRQALGLVALVQNDEIDRLKAENDALREDAERYRWLSQVSTMADKLSPGTVDHAIMLHQAMERVEIPDFTPGNGNKARRRAEELGIDYDAAMTNEAGKAPDAQ